MIIFFLPHKNKTLGINIKHAKWPPSDLTLWTLTLGEILAKISLFFGPFEDTKRTF